MRSGSSNVRLIVTKLQSRRGLPVIVAAVIVLFIFYFASKGGDAVYAPASVGKVTREPEKETDKPVPDTQDVSKRKEQVPVPDAAPADDSAGRKAVSPDHGSKESQDSKSEEKEASKNTDKVRAPAVVGEASGEFELKTGIQADTAKQDAVRAELKFSWDSYKKYAWGHGWF
jgi:hypothetical protein